MTAHRALPVWRSLLYVPVNVPRFVASALKSPADAVILDLEDAIVPDEKAHARSLLSEVVGGFSQQPAPRPDLLVRVNSPWRLLMQDLEAAVISGVRAIVLPKARNREHVLMAAEIIESLEEERNLPLGGIGLVPLIETTAALGEVEKIANAHERVLAISLGDEDFCTSAGCEANEDTLRYPKQKLSLAAHQAGVLALGYLGTLASYRDLDDFPALLQRARAFGYSGAPCIHPSQVPHLNAAFQPTAKEMDHAHRIMTAMQTLSQTPARGAFSLDGKMIDKPAVERAHATLALARRIAEKENAH